MYLKIKLGNDALSGENKQFEVARILEVAADKIQDGEAKVLLRDVNGNTVGQADLETDLQSDEPQEASIILHFETGNAAFEDNGVEWESARILRDAAERVRDQADFDFKLRDLNGNTVGSLMEHRDPPEKKAVPRASSEVNDPTP
jgi:hypothetical protein